MNGFRLPRHELSGTTGATRRFAHGDFGISLFCVFLILAAQYESWSLPFSVLLCTPIAVFGAFAGLMVGRFENNGVCADRFGDADWLERKECDSDR
ncbi:MAG: efflux RND transporter permease subunit [Limisphaerales bacterium]